MWRLFSLLRCTVLIALFPPAVQRFSRPEFRWIWNRSHVSRCGQHLCACVAFSKVFGEGPYGYGSWNTQTQWLILNFRKFMGLKIPEDGCFGWVWWESIGYFAILVLVLAFGPRYLTWGNWTSTSSENLKTKGQRTSKMSTWKLDNFFQKTLKILGYPPGPRSRKTSIWNLWNLAMTLVWKGRSHSWKSSCLSSMRQHISFRVPWHPRHRVAWCSIAG